jgi:hypothetical protein
LVEVVEGKEGGLEVEEAGVEPGGEARGEEESGRPEGGGRGDRRGARRTGDECREGLVDQLTGSEIGYPKKELKERRGRRKEKGEGRREKGEGRREKGEGGLPAISERSQGAK